MESLARGIGIAIVVVPVVVIVGVILFAIAKGVVANIFDIVVPIVFWLGLIGGVYLLFRGSLFGLLWIGVAVLTIAKGDQIEEFSDNWRWRIERRK
jgi:hypothetical protein